MKLIVSDPLEARRLIRERRRSGHDRFDEVWDGVYVIMPDPNPEHFILATMLSHILLSALDPGLISTVTAGGNVSDRREGWTKNYRCPDLLVFLRGSLAALCETHWIGGPDFAVEILSPRDRARKKLDFYAKVGVRELLLIDRKPWRLELFRLADGSLRPAGVVEPGTQDSILSEVLSLSFRLEEGQPRPRIAISRPADGQTWTA